MPRFNKIRFVKGDFVMEKKISRVLISLFLFSFFIVPASATASVFDLSEVSDPDVTINTAIFSRTSNSGQGTGNFESFLRTQATGHETTQKGYNTDGTLEFQTKGGIWTHSVLLSDIPLVTIDGIDYREFLLDAAEPGPTGGAANALNIDVFKLYLLASANVTGYPANFPAGNLMYDLGAGNSVLINNITGNGFSDLFAYIPNINFSGSDPYLYLYTEFGNFAGSFEEWGYRTSSGNPPGDGNPVPEPSSVILIGSGLLGLAGIRRRFIA